MIRYLLVLFFSITVISCSTQGKESQISSDEGISWIGVTDCNERNNRWSNGYGFTLFSSGKIYEFYYDYETNKRMPVYFQCFDCGYPETINEALVNWKLDKDTLKLSRYPLKFDKYTNLIFRNIKEDSLFVSEIRGKNSFECKYIMIKLKNSILDTLITDNILSPRG